MHHNRPQSISPPAFLEGRTLIVLPKHPWDEPLQRLERFTLFRRHVCPPTDSPERDPLEVATDVALDQLYAAGKLTSDMTSFHAGSMCLSEAARTAQSIRISKGFEAAFGEVQRIRDHNRKHLLPVLARFTLEPPERVRLFGRAFDSAHAAADEAIPALIDLWRMTRQLVDDLDPGPAATAMPELFLETLRQLESAPLDELLLQVSREHRRLREDSRTTQCNSVAESARTVLSAWSGAHTKKVLAGFFAVDARLLMRELRERQIVYRKGSRQSYRIDLNTLEAGCRMLFQEQFER